MDNARDLAVSPLGLTGVLLLLLLLQNRAPALMPWVLFLQLIIPLPVPRALRVLRAEHRPIDLPLQIGAHLCVVTCTVPPFDAIITETEYLAKVHSL